MSIEVALEIFAGVWLVGGLGALSMMVSAHKAGAREAPWVWCAVIALGPIALALVFYLSRDLKE